jgi:hypothetical protein
MVEQRPFKALVVGSSPTQPKFNIPAVTPWEVTNSAIPGRSEATPERHHHANVRCSLLQFFWAVLAGFTLLTPGQHTHPCLLLGHRRDLVRFTPTDTPGIIWLRPLKLETKGSAA